MNCPKRGFFFYCAKYVPYHVILLCFVLPYHRIESFSIHSHSYTHLHHYHRGHEKFHKNRAVIPVSHVSKKIHMGHNNEDDNIMTNHDIDNNNENNNSNQHQNNINDIRMSRRSLFISTTMAAGTLCNNPQPSNAGLVQFPCNYKLMNTYHIMRAGESLLESEDILSTNPLFLTNRDDALSSKGVAQVEDACRDMMSRGINPSVLKYSLAAKCMDTADIIASQMQVGRNRLIPEYTFMDPRGVGLWDKQPISTIEEAIWAMDNDEAGKDGEGGKPPAHEDGTPNETLFNQAIRLRQLMSVLETQFSGDVIVLVFPDGATPSLLMCLMAGIPLNRVHEFEFKPGEVKYDVTYESILKIFPTEPSPEYNEAIIRGREILKKARADPSQFMDEGDGANNIDYYQPMTSAPKRKEDMEDVDRKEITPSEYLSFLGIGFLGLAGKLLLPEEEKVDDDEVVEPTQKTVNTADSRIEQSSGLQRLYELNVTAPFEIPEMKEQLNIEEEKKEKVAMANNAMENYMDRDDGGDEWLNMMNSLMDEE